MKFLKEFKEFITRGNFLDMAVGVIIGGAFTAIVTALTGQILQPLINWLIASIAGDKGLESAVTMLKEIKVDGVVDWDNSIYIDWGAFITAIINFLLVAIILFCIIKTINHIREKGKEAIENRKNKGEEPAEEEAHVEEAPVEVAPAAPAGPTQEELLAEIRDLLKAQSKE